jgi:predicted nucleic acid-binding protein
MLRFFKPLTTHEQQEQVKVTAVQAAAAVATAAAAKHQRDLLLPKPGRPRSLVNLVAPSSIPDPEPASKRPKQYKDWFTSDAIHHILESYRRNNYSSFRTVAQLQHEFPQLYESLSRSTIDSWHADDGKTLKQEKQEQLLALQKTRRGKGEMKAFAISKEAEAAEVEIKKQLEVLREQGAVINLHITGIVMRVVLEKHCATLLASLKLSKSFIGRWLREEMNFSWRSRTTAAQKLPNDWRERGLLMAKRIAVNVKQYSVHPSLIINMDQTGLHLVPSSTRTYAWKASKEVPVIGAEDKRQITCCIASSMSGHMLPLQLIFTGKTKKCLPNHTPASTAASVHLTHSQNHWSNQTTMQEYIAQVIVPYGKEQAQKHGLIDHHIILILDVWAVHKSVEFRQYLRQHPNIHLVFVPPNCTSKLQVADVILQRPFKHGIQKCFNEWAAETLRVQYSAGAITGLNAHLKMKFIKPNILQWALQSWSQLNGPEGSLYIQSGWKMCVSNFFDPLIPANQEIAVKEQLEGKLDFKWVPDEDESEKEEDDDEGESSDEEKDVLDVMKKKVEGMRKSSRVRKQPAAYGIQLQSNQISMVETGSEDSDANGM